MILLPMISGVTQGVLFYSVMKHLKRIRTEAHLTKYQADPAEISGY